MSKKNQHYVPQFHLRKWSYDGKRISLFNKLNEVFVDSIAPIKSVASKDYMYGETDDVENMLWRIENEIAPIYEKVIKNNSVIDLTSTELTFLYLHLVLGNERTLATAERQGEFVKGMLYEVLRMKQAHGQDLEIDLNSFKDSFSVKCSHSIFIKAALELFPLITDLKLSLIVNMSEVEFLTSDYPTIKYNLWGLKRKLFSGWGLSSAGIMFICPISPHHALLAYDDVIYNAKDERQTVIKIRNKSQISEINKLMLLNAQGNLFFTNNVKEHYIKKLTKNLKTYNEKEDVMKVFGNTDNKLVCYSGKKILYEADLRFLEIFEETLHLPVPMHAQGLLRPASENMAKAIKEYD